ncbi:plasmid mobilization protein [Xanthomonas phaseoli]|uniref:MobA/MobL family protein n=1 Tax=Xanthomonas phaseoli TaxID=1985254 RepID=UPI003B002C5A
MAIYHANLKTFSRAKGHSSVAAAAYRAGLLLADERTGTRHDYRRRDGVVETRIIAPEHAPDWALVPAELWTAAEAAERRKDATVAREFEFALPHELDDGQRSALAVEVTRALVNRYGFAAQASIHSPGTKDGLNYHVHVLATTRRVGPDGLADKTRELDGGPSGRAEVEWVRELVAAKTNAHLVAAELGARVDHRSLKAQADEALANGDLATAAVLSREPTQHVGKNGTAIERRGRRSERAEVNQAVEEANEETFRKLVALFEDQGRAMPVPEGHDQAQAVREARRPPAILSLPLSSGQGQIVVNRRLARAMEGRGSMAAGEGRAATVPPSAEELFAEAADLWSPILDQALAQTLRATRQLLAWAKERALAFAQNTRLPSDLKELVRRLRRFKASLLKFSRRLDAVRRAERLCHMAEQSWEDFTVNHAQPGPSWSSKDWTQRRGRRLSTLEMRTQELAEVRALVTPEQQAVCEEEAEVAGKHLEAWSHELLGRYRLASEPAEILEGQESAMPAPTLAPGVHRRPRLH